MLDPRFRGDDKCIEHPSLTDPLLPPLIRQDNPHFLPVFFYNILVEI